MRQFQADLRKTEELARRLEQQRAALAQEASAAQASLTEVQGKLSAASTENLLSKERLAALQADLNRREQDTQVLEQKLAETEKAAQSAQAEKQQLSAQLQVSETEKRLTREQITELRGTVGVERQEKAKLQEHATALATNVASLAKKSGELTQEIRDYRSLAPNTIFNQFLSNRITVKFEATRAGVFGRDVNKDKSSQSILFTEGLQNYLLLHASATPFSLWNPGTDWNRVTAILQRGTVAVGGARLSFLAEDPRVVVIPIDDAQAKQFGVKIYQAAADPFKFQDAVIVGANDGYYGECKFQIDLSTPNYVKVDRSLLKGLFGKFNPSRGDLVLTKTGELLGIMVNSEYCVVLNKVTPTRTIRLGTEVISQQTGQMLSQLYDRVYQMPLKLH
jgi:multidrug efflux pump subunit AcrA (membrane-fusion protein)